MPEGDAVRLTAQRLDRAIGRSVLTGADLRVPALATVDLAGATVLGTHTYGKHLLTRLDHDGHAVTLHTHLRMDGSWRTLTPGQQWPRPGHEARAVLRTQRAEAVGFLLGVVELLSTSEEPTIIGHLGPDLLMPWTEPVEREAVSRLTADPDRILGEALLDQTVVAGLGTIWLSEACFVHGISPLAPVSALTDPTRFLRRAAQLLASGVRNGRPITTGDRREPLWVYRRQQRPCLRCGTILASGRLGPPTRERTTYWCPSCQRA